MTRRHRYIQVFALSALFVLGAGTFFLKGAHAAGGQIYLTPANQSIQVGSTFTVSLRVNPGEAVNAVTASIGYDASKLSLQGVDCSGSPFSAFPSCPTSGNPISVTGAILGGSTSSDSLVATVTFKALAGTGTGAITLSGDAANTSGSAIGASAAGTTLTFTTPVTTPTTPVTTPVGGSTGSSGGSKVATPTPAKTVTTPTTTTTPAATTTTSTGTATTAPTVNVTGQAVQYTLATISATSSQPTQDYIQFGTSADALTSKTEVSDFGTTHDLSIDPTLLVPGQTYYYVIVAKNQQGVITQTTPVKFTTTGLTISVAVYDKNNKPIANKQVTLHSVATTATTDKNGIATFKNVIPGTHHVLYTTNNTTYDKAVDVKNNVQTSGTTQTAAVQKLAVVYGFGQKSSSAAIGWASGIVLLVIVGAAVVLLAKKRGQPASFGGGTTAAAVVMSDPSVSTPQLDSLQDLAVQVKTDLDKIPSPNKPQPGSTIAPIAGEAKEEGKF